MISRKEKGTTPKLTEKDCKFISQFQLIVLQIHRKKNSKKKVKKKGC